MVSDVEALLEERRGYANRGLSARVAQVDAVLADLGVKVSDDDLETADAAPRKVKRRPVKKS